MDVSVGHLLLIGQTASLAWLTYLAIGSHFEILLGRLANLRGYQMLTWSVWGVVGRFLIHYRLWIAALGLILLVQHVRDAIGEGRLIS